MESEERHQRSISRADVLSILSERRNWMRWGKNDEKGALNLITDDRRRAATDKVRSGQVISLSRPFPKNPGPTNLRPANHYVMHEPLGDGGVATDYLGIDYHGIACTHIDALCHAWGADGMWSGKRADEVFSSSGSEWAGIDNWREGIFTRGVLLDIPRYRGTSYVTEERPVQAHELEDLCREQGIEVTPGDALVIYSGREEWDRRESLPWGSGSHRPGLHASCLSFIRDTDCSTLVWDMMDMVPNGLDLSWSVHAAIFSFGVALIDNALLEDLAVACAQAGRHDFLFVASPLRVEGGTGSPINPLAIL
jgi:kynurenine formamidase